jgi:CRP-like cAMP-binding protein
MRAQINFLVMNRNYLDEIYRVWAHDNQVYGPIDLAMLSQWAQEGRVLGGTWIYLEKAREWRQAKRIDPLHDLFPAGDETVFLEQQSFEGSGPAPEELRQVPTLASLSNAALAQLIRLGELQRLRAGEVVLKKGEPGDALYFVLAGRLRARLVVGFQDRTLAQIPAGEAFGEMAMFTQSPRSADVVAEEPTRLLRLSAESFRRLIDTHPDAAAPVLFSIARMMALRIQDHNQRFQKDAAAEFLWR